MSTTPVERPEAETSGKAATKPPRAADKFAAARDAKKKAKRLRHRKTIRRSNSNG